jgi:hypothetical protein
MPSARVRAWKSERDAWLKRRPEPHSTEDRLEYQRQFSERWERWLDESHGECLLWRPELRLVVEETLLAGLGSAYHLGEFVVMPNHVHVLVAPVGDGSLSQIVGGWKSITSRRINRLLGRRGMFWQKESFDHLVRSADKFDELSRYIRDNPKHLPQRFRKGAGV